VRAKRYAVVAAAAALAVTGTIVSAAPASALSCPTVLLDGTVIASGDTTYVGCDLDGAHLDGLVLGSVAGSSLVGASLRGVSLRGSLGGGSPYAAAVLTGADLTDADLSGATGSGVDLSGAELAGAQLAGARISSVVLAGTKLAGARLAGSAITVSAGSPATLPAQWAVVLQAPGAAPAGFLAGPGVDLSYQVLDHPTFSNLSLAAADLHYSHITAGTFVGVDLAGADFRHTWLTDVDFTGAFGFGLAMWDGAYQIQSVCPDGVRIEKHNKGVCTEPVDTTPPVVTLPGGDVWLLTSTTSFRVVVSETGSGLTETQARWRSSRSGRTSWTSWSTSGWTYDPQAAPWPVQLDGSAQRYCVQVRARDNAGLVSAWSNIRCSETPYDDLDEYATYTGWSMRNASWATGGSYHVTQAHGASMVLGRTLTVRRVGVLAITCAGCGRVAVYVGSKKVGSISLNRSTAARRALLLLPRLTTPLSGKVRLVVTSPSGQQVRLDGISVSAA
jgi:uncharacterized protein YjbI with pentapeptide repeats